jgi:predicted nuclease of predicted toxin-antitoxin system
MRLLADENFPRAVVDWLRDSGHDVLWARTAAPGAKDTDLLNLAEAEGRLVVTLDSDFWQISLQRRAPLLRAGVVLFRIHPATPGRIESLVHAFLLADNDWTGHVSTVSPEGIQMARSKHS